MEGVAGRGRYGRAGFGRQGRLVTEGRGDMFIVVVGPIDYWWNENWETDEHFFYTTWRDGVCKQLVEAGHLVYRPHEAFKGAWDERAQRVNDAAIDACDAMVNVGPPGVPAYGTAAEVKRFFDAYAEDHGEGSPLYYEAPPGDYRQIAKLVQPLDEPYGSVQRKSYTRSDET